MELKLKSAVTHPHTGFSRCCLLLGKIPQYRNGCGAFDGLAAFGCRKHPLPSHGIQASLIQAIETGTGLDGGRDDPPIRGHGHLHDASARLIGPLLRFESPI